MVAVPVFSINNWWSTFSLSCHLTLLYLAGMNSFLSTFLSIVASVIVTCSDFQLLTSYISSIQKSSNLRETCTWQWPSSSYFPRTYHTSINICRPELANTDSTGKWQLIALTALTQSYLSHIVSTCVSQVFQITFHIFTYMSRCAHFKAFVTKLME